MRESLVRDHFAATFDGVPEFRTDFGRVDVVLPTEVVEVEPFSSWRHGVRQALAYAQETGKRPAVAIYGAVTKEAALNLWRLCSGLVSVYMLDGQKWRRVESEKDAARDWAMPPSDLKYRPPAKRKARMSPEMRALMGFYAEMFDVRVATFVKWPGIAEWIEKNDVNATHQLDLFDGPAA